jgi:hypothetical protein
MTQAGPRRRVRGTEVSDSNFEIAAEATSGQHGAQHTKCCPTVPSRPALALLITYLARLSGRQRNEIASKGRRAKAVTPRIRRLTRDVTAEARRLIRELAQ